MQSCLETDGKNLLQKVQRFCQQGDERVVQKHCTSILYEYVCTYLWEKSFFRPVKQISQSIVLPPIDWSSLDWRRNQSINPSIDHWLDRLIFEMCIQSMAFPSSGSCAKLCVPWVERGIRKFAGYQVPTHAGASVLLPSELKNASKLSTLPGTARIYARSHQFLTLYGLPFCTWIIKLCAGTKFILANKIWREQNDAFYTADLQKCMAYLRMLLDLDSKTKDAFCWLLQWDFYTVLVSHWKRWFNIKESIASPRPFTVPKRCVPVVSSENLFKRIECRARSPLPTGTESAGRL